MAVNLTKEQIESAYSRALFFFCILIYTATAYGGIRSPDAEIIFRSAETFADKGSLAVEKPIEYLEEFGIARALDGNNYPVFGPLQSIAALPFVVLGDSVAKHYPVPVYSVPLSHYQNNGLTSIIQNTKPDNMSPHVKRMVAGYFNVLVSALSVLVFWFIGRRFSENLNARLIVTLILAFATPLWQYSSTFFSEPLAILLTLISFYLLLWSESDNRKVVSVARIFSGLFLGLAVATHISFILFAPFFLIPIFKNKQKLQIKAAVLFTFGISIILAALAWYNYSRFGSIFETGRSVNPELIDKLGYGRFVLPFEGLYGLLFGSAKGILLFSPIIILSLFVWKSFHQKHKVLSFSIIALVVFRIIFIASRSDWAAGFCLGPRYLICLLPFLILPLFTFFDELLTKNDLKKYALLIGLIIIAFFQQIYFALGEVFIYDHLVKYMLMEENRADWLNLLQTDWRYSPLFRLHEIELLPHLLRNLVDSYHVWLFVLLALVSLPLVPAFFLNGKMVKRS